MTFDDVDPALAGAADYALLALRSQLARLEEAARNARLAFESASMPPEEASRLGHACMAEVRTCMDLWITAETVIGLRKGLSEARGQTWGRAHA